jgi:hypothetical protein
MDTSHLHLNKNLSITFHIFPWHYKLWDELVRISVWNKKRQTGSREKVLQYRALFLRMCVCVCVCVCVCTHTHTHTHIYIYTHTHTLQYMALFYSIWLYFTGYSSVLHHICITFFIYKERLYMVPDIINVFINYQLL